MRSITIPFVLALAACQSSGSTDAATTTPSDTTNATEAAATEAMISAPFLGVWDEGAAACAEPFSMSRFTIVPTEISWFGGTGDVTAVRGDGGRVEVDLGYVAEGSPSSEPEPTTTTLSMSDAGRLSLGLGGGREGLVRCEGGTGRGFGS